MVFIKGDLYQAGPSPGFLTFLLTLLLVESKAMDSQKTTAFWTELISTAPLEHENARARLVGAPCESSAYGKQ